MNRLPRQPRGRWTGAQRALTAVLVVASVAFLARRALSDWSELSRFDLRLAPGPLLLHLALTGACFALLSLGWHRLLRALGATLPATASAHAWFVGGLARYVPGKVVSLVGRVMLCRNHGVAGSVAAVALLVEQLLFAALAAVFLLVAGVARAPALPPLATGLFLAVLAAALLLLLHPRIFRPLTTWGLKISGLGSDGLHLGYGTLAGVAVLFVAGWGLYGLGGYFLVESLVAVDRSALPALAAAFLGAWAAGFVAFLTPAGLGVREATLVLLLSGPVADAPALAAALLGRLTWVAVELAGAGISTWLVRRRPAAGGTGAPGAPGAPGSDTGGAGRAPTP